MIQGITWLLGFQLVGETLSYATGGQITNPHRVLFENQNSSSHITHLILIVGVGDSDG